MYLFKLFLIVLSLVSVVLAGWMYVTRDVNCGDQPWWIVAILGLGNLAFAVYLFNKKAA